MTRRLSATSLLHRHRRLLAALCAAGCVLALGLSLRPAPPPSTAAVVVIRAVPGGATIGPDDVAVRAVPDAALPDGALAQPDAAVGRIAVAPLPRGAVLTSDAVLSPRFGRTGPGMVLAPVRLADADVGALLAAGDVIDIVAATEGRATVIASGARVVAVPARPAAGGPLGAGGDTNGVLVIVEVPGTVAASLAQAAAGARLSIALR